MKNVADPEWGTPHTSASSLTIPLPAGHCFQVLFFVDFIERESSSVFECITTTSSAPWATPSPGLLFFPLLFLSLSYFLLAPNIEATSCKRAAHPEEELLLHGTAWSAISANMKNTLPQELEVAKQRKTNWLWVAMKSGNDEKPKELLFYVRYYFFLCCVHVTQ